MYIPSHFAETDPETIHRFIETHSFGLLVSQVAGRPFATHLPMLLERGANLGAVKSDSLGAAKQGALVGHLARANPHWQSLESCQVMAVFSGPHAYISPTWYESKQVVPTWNYAAVHVYGTVRMFEDPQRLLKIVEDSVSTYEKHFPSPWSLPDEPQMVERLLRQIVGFRLEIERIEAKFKMSQNQPLERKEKVIRALRAHQNEESHAVAQLMEARLSSQA